LQVPLMDGGKAERELGLTYHSAKEVRAGCDATHIPRSAALGLMLQSQQVLRCQSFAYSLLVFTRRLQAFAEELQAVATAQQSAAQTGGA
jgi:hypothetical protein